MMTRSVTRKIRTAIAPGLALWLTLKLAHKQGLTQHSESGFTLIEGLVAIIIVSITVISITPPIFWATASRAQTRRAEQALQLAQGEIDRVRALVERQPENIKLTDLPPSTGTNEETVRTSVDTPNVAKTTNMVTTASLAKCANRDDSLDAGITTDPKQFIQVDINADCEVDFLVQTFRSNGLNNEGNAVLTGQAPAGFVMGVRVYSAVAKRSISEGKTLRSDAGSLVGTTGLGNQQLQPLAVLYSTIVPSNRSGNLDLYRKLCSPTTDPDNLTGKRGC